MVLHHKIEYSTAFSPSSENGSSKFSFDSSRGFSLRKRAGLTLLRHSTCFQSRGPADGRTSVCGPADVIADFVLAAFVLRGERFVLFVTTTNLGSHVEQPTNQRSHDWGAGRARCGRKEEAQMALCWSDDQQQSRKFHGGSRLEADVTSG